MPKLTHICIATLILLQAPFCAAQGIDAPITQQSLAARIDASIAGYFKPGDPGATVIVTKDDKPIFRKAYGLADLATQQPMKVNMDFRVGSVTKQFTATAIMLLVDERRLKLDDDIRSYLPNFPDKGSKITIEHLLTHSSGLVDFTTKPDFFAINMKRQVTPAQLIDSFKDDPLEFEPGSATKYSSSGYALLGAIIEKVGRLPYAEFMAERIFVPLDMYDTAVDGHQRGPRLRALGHARSNSGAWEPAPGISMSQAFAGGDIVSTVDDLARWDSAIAHHRLLKAATWRRVFTPYTLRDGTTSKFGLGWEIGSLLGQPLISHGGSINGFNSFTMRLPEARLYVAVLGNANVESRTAESFVVASKAAAIALGQPYPEYKTIALDANAVKAVEGIYQFEKKQATVRSYKGDLLLDLSGHQPFKLLPYSPQGFVIENSLATVELSVGEQGAFGKLTLLDGPRNTVYQRTADGAPKRVAIALPEAAFDTYTGRFQVVPGLVLEVTRSGKQFYVQPSGQPKLEVFAMSANEFFAETVDAQLRFETEGQGKVTRAVVKMGGREMPAIRIE